MNSAPRLSCLIVIMVALFGARLAQAAPAVCFSASKVYRVHPAGGGPDVQESWHVTGDAFAQCVRREEAAEKLLRDKYPAAAYTLFPTATIGCHSPCNE